MGFTVGVRMAVMLSLHLLMDIVHYLSLRKGSWENVFNLVIFFVFSFTKCLVIS